MNIETTYLKTRYTWSFVDESKTSAFLMSGDMNNYLYNVEDCKKSAEEFFANEDFLRDMCGIPLHKLKTKTFVIVQVDWYSLPAEWSPSQIYKQGIIAYANPNLCEGIKWVDCMWKNEHEGYKVR